jgi:hypothetical protein
MASKNRQKKEDEKLAFMEPIFPSFKIVSFVK